MQSTKTIPLDEVKEVAAALASELRIHILKLLSTQELSLNEISEKLSIPLSTATTNVKQLEDAGLVHCEMRPAKRGLKKVCIQSVANVIFHLIDDELPEKSNTIVQNMPIGRYSDFQISPTCGLASATGIISYVDDPVSFYVPEASDAQLIWFSSGYLEYNFPNRIPQNAQVTDVELLMEICSEAPGYNLNWPSDIFVEINDVMLGVFTSPGDFGGKKGMLTPAWWETYLTQYGQQKHWIVTQNGSYIDGVKVSSVRVSDLQLKKNNAIKVRIGVKPDAKNVGGINLFGSKFGNYEHDIRLKIKYE